MIKHQKDKPHMTRWCDGGSEGEGHTLGLYSAFLAWRAIFFRSSLHPRSTVDTIFLHDWTTPDLNKVKDRLPSLIFFRLFVCCPRVIFCTYHTRHEKTHFTLGQQHTTSLRDNTYVTYHPEALFHYIPHQM